MGFKLISWLVEGNAQLFRELKGRLKSQNIALASAISLVGQILLYFYYKSLLPIAPGFNRYCTGSPPPNWEGYRYSGSQIPNNYCVKDLLGNWMIIKELWWLDIFIGLSVIGIFALLVVGTYLLIDDLSREERRGTLNFIRLSPQSAKSIFLGKILGVPILLYLMSGLALPLHLIAGLSAHISLSLILVFYGVLIISCVFFYSAALLFGLVSAGLGGFQSILGSGAILLFLVLMTGITMSGSIIINNSFDWLILLYPGTALSYLVQVTFLPPQTIGYLNIEELADLRWYGQLLWSKAWMGIGFILLNYILCTYWLGQGLKRRFHNPSTTLISKSHSYLISGSFIVILLGFTLQKTDSHLLFESFVILQVFLVIFFLLLIAALSPHRQVLQDWARYRHQFNDQSRSLLKDLVKGEKSPSTVAIALNLGIVIIYLLPSLLLFSSNEDKLAILLGLLMGASMILIYAMIAQLILLMKTPKRAILAVASVCTLMVLPVTCFAILKIEPNQIPWLWQFSFLPLVATKYAIATTALTFLFGQGLAITLISFQLTKQLQKVGRSATKMLLAKG